MSLTFISQIYSLKWWSWSFINKFTGKDCANSWKKHNRNLACRFVYAIKLLKVVKSPLYLLFDLRSKISSKLVKTFSFESHSYYNHSLHIINEKWSLSHHLSFSKLKLKSYLVIIVSDKCIHNLPFLFVYLVSTRHKTLF